MTAPDDPRAQAAGECDVAAIGARAAAAARIERYTLPAEVLALIADVPVLLAHIAAEPAHAALAGAVRAERALTSQYEGAWAAHIAGGAPLDAAEGVLALSDRLDAARDTIDALLRGAPGGYVPARVVREYLDAAAASENDRGDVDRITDAIERGLSMNYPGLTDANRRAGVSGEALHLARAAVDAALAAAGCP